MTSALPLGWENIDWRFKFLAEEKIRLNIAIKRSFLNKVYCEENLGEQKEYFANRICLVK
jgi:hypothetical protein